MASQGQPATEGYIHTSGETGWKAAEWCSFKMKSCIEILHVAGDKLCESTF